MDSPNSVVPSLGGARLGKTFTSYELLDIFLYILDIGRLYTKTRFMQGIVTSNNHCFIKAEQAVLLVSVRINL